MEAIRKKSKALYYMLLSLAVLVPSLYLGSSGKASKVNVQPYSGMGSTSNKELNLFKYNISQGQAQSSVSKGLVLFVTLDPEGLAFEPTWGDMICRDQVADWKPTAGEMPYAFAVVSDLAASKNSTPNYKYTWYDTGSRQLRYAYGDNNEYNSLIIPANHSQQNYTTGIYRQELRALFDSIDGETILTMKDQWRGLITTDKQQASKNQWRYIAGTDGTDAYDRLYTYLGYTSNMRDNINDQSKWSDEERTQGFISYLDLLMTGYSCVSGSPEAQQYWGTMIDRYISEGPALGETAGHATVPFNLAILPGTTLNLPKNASPGSEEMTAVTGLMDIWNYAYQIQKIYDYSTHALAKELAKGPEYGVIERYDNMIAVARANRESLQNMEASEFPVTLPIVYTTMEQMFWKRYNVADPNNDVKAGGEFALMEKLVCKNVLGYNEIYGAVHAFAMPQTLNMGVSTLTGNFKVAWANEDSSYKILNPSLGNVSDSVRFRMNFSCIPGEEAVWQSIANSYTDFRMFIKPKRVYDTKVNVKEGGTETPNSANTENYSPSKGADGIEVKLTKAEFGNLVQGKMAWLQAYDISMLNQSLQMGEMLTLGYDLEVDFAWYTDGKEKGRVSVPLSGYSKIDAATEEERKQKAETSPYVLTVYREEEHTNSIVYYTEPTAYAEIKQGTVEMDGNGGIEDYEAMAGVPSTEFLYYASGGSEFILEFELEYIEGEKGVRWYNSIFYGTECEFKHNDQFKPIEAKGKTTDSSASPDINILKEKFVADDEGKDYPEPKEVDAEYYDGYIPQGAASYSVNLKGHKTCTNTENLIEDTYMEDSQPIVATWTGLIKNSKGTTHEQAPASSHISGYIQGNPAPSCQGGQDGKAGNFAESDTEWDVEAYHKAVDEALTWVKAYEKTNETFTVLKWSDSDNYQRIWKIGDAQVQVSFANGESNMGSGARPAGTYTSSNLATAKKDGTQANFGYNFSFAYGTDGVKGTHAADDGDPPDPHGGDADGVETVGSTVDGTGDITYTISVTFPKSSNGTNRLQAHELCGACCCHNLRGLTDTWSQYSQYDYAQFKTCRVYKIHRSYVDGMEEITFADYGKENSEEAGNHLMASGPINSYTWFGTEGNKGTWLANWRDGREVITAKQQAQRHNGTDTIVGAITQGDPNIFYNIAMMNNAQDDINRQPYKNGTDVGPGVGYGYAFEVRQQLLERNGQAVPDKDLTDWPNGSLIIRSTQSGKAGRIRYSYLPNYLEQPHIVEYSQRGNITATRSYDSSYDGTMNYTLYPYHDFPWGSRSNKCDGEGYDGALKGYGGQACDRMTAKTTDKCTNNPVQVDANGHKKPKVKIKDPKLVGDKASGGLSPRGSSETDILNFSNGCLYETSRQNHNPSFGDEYGDDEFFMQTLTKPDDRTCTSVAIEGTAELAGKYQDNSDGVVKDKLSNTVDWYDYRSEEYYRFRFRRNQTNKIFVISDMLILQTSTGDQPVMYHWKSQTKRLQQHYDYTSADVEPRMAGVDSFTSTNITLKEDFRNMWYNQRQGDKTKTEDWYTATAMGWGVNNIGQPGQVNVGGYTGNFENPDNKYSDTGLDLVTMNATEGNGNQWAKDEYWTRFPEGFATLFDHTANVYERDDLDVFVGHHPHAVDGYGWGAAWPEYLQGPAYIGFNGSDGAFYGCAKENNKGYEAAVTSIRETTGGATYTGGGLGRWHWGAVVDTSSRDPYKASPNQRLDASYHAPGAWGNRSGESRMSNVAGLRIVTDMIEQDPTNPNQEYETGDAYQTYINILDWPKIDDGEMLDGLGVAHTVTPNFNRNEFAESKKAGLAGFMTRQRYFDDSVWKVDEDDNKTTKGLVIDATYSDNHTKVNNIVVHDPISVQNALIVHNEAADKNGWYADTRTTDITTFSKENLDDKKAELEVCPEDDTCEFKVLKCKYFDDKVYLSLDFNKDSGAKVDSEGRGTVHNLAYDLETDMSIKNNMLKDIDLGDYRIVDKLIKKEPVKDDPNTAVNEGVDENGNINYTVEEIKPFGGSNKQFLEAMVEDRGGAKMSIPLDKLGLTPDNMKDHKLSVEFDIYMDTDKLADGKTYREPTMLVGFNGLGFYLPKNEEAQQQKYSFTTGNGVEKYTTQFETYGNATRLRIEWDFSENGATNTKLFYNGKEITGFNTENNSKPLTQQMIFGNSKGYLNIGCWTQSSDFVSRFYLDNLKVTLNAGTAQHTDACYKNETLYESSTMYLCTTPRMWETKEFSSAKPYLWTVPSDGKYKLQAWGAAGGGGDSGLGGYSSGYISLKKGEQLMIYPGSAGDYTVTGADYEYLWTIDNECGAPDRYSLEGGTLPGGDIIDISSLGYNVKYVNSITGQDKTPISKGIWSSINPNETACGAHSFSVAIYTSGPATGEMVKRIDRSAKSQTVKKIYNFNYVGAPQEWTAPEDGFYQLEAWGAGGAKYNDTAQDRMVGEGGYTSGIVYLTKGTTLYIYTGQKGINSTYNSPAPATFNGGGNGGLSMSTKEAHLGGSGGGATDFRLVNGAWNNAAGLQSRVLVAGGGGSAGCASAHNPGHGGGLTGRGTVSTYGGYVGAATEGGSQKVAGRGAGQYPNKSAGGFGYGANAAQCGAGGGGGYYGGGSEYTAGGSGGSSFVTGYEGCDTTYRGQHRGLTFQEVNMTQGGNTGAGKARIKQLSSMNLSTKAYGFTGNVQTFTAPRTGQYTLETWGAQGGGNIGGMESFGGLGGYAKRTVNLKAGETVYIYVGGQGKAAGGLGQGGGWNGGGQGGPGGYGGGGMTHISTTQNPATATLTTKQTGNGYTAHWTHPSGCTYSGETHTWYMAGNYITNKCGVCGHGCRAGNPWVTSNIVTTYVAGGSWSPAGTLLVAGGGGGSDNVQAGTIPSGTGDDGAGGHGGGTVGDNAKVTGAQVVGTGGTQTSGFMQGAGQSATSATDTGGGGGGWYGGKVTNNNNGGAGGGSGYAPNGTQINGQNVGDGRALISWIGENKADTWAGGGFNGGGSGGADGFGGGGASDVRRVTTGGVYRLVEGSETNPTSSLMFEHPEPSEALTYGPYIDAQPGWYQVDIYGAGLSDCTFDVYDNSLGGVIYQNDQLQDIKYRPEHVSFYFYLSQELHRDIANYKGLEVRVHHEGSSNYRFDSLYLSRLDDRLIVAGGGGGSDDYTKGQGANDGAGGYGGELIAQDAKVNGAYVLKGIALSDKLQATINSKMDTTSKTWKALEGIMYSGCGRGAGQDFGYALGRGESVSYNTSTGGAGGGWYGGFVTNHPNGGGGGGSNYLSQSLSETHQEGANNPGHGKVLIQLEEHELSQGNTQVFGFQPITGLANQAHNGSKRIEGSVQEFTVPETGEYKLEVWGAQGGDARQSNSVSTIPDSGGKGGYTSAYVTLEKGTKLYVYVGGEGNTNTETRSGSFGAGGWNGGGDGGTTTAEDMPESGAGGGGMTHISLVATDKIDSGAGHKFSRDRVLVVAGGGGGAGCRTIDYLGTLGGEGGGTWGYTYSSYSFPGNQASNSGSGQAHGKPGYNGGASNPNNRDGSGGNGAGWYGGGHPDTQPARDNEGGAGGSGYINVNIATTVNGTKFPLIAGQILSGRDMQPTPVALTTDVELTGQYAQLGNKGNGAARITKVERGHNASCETEVTTGDTPFNTHVHNKDCLLAPSKVNYYYEDTYNTVNGKGPGTTGKLEGAIRQYVLGNHKPLEMLVGSGVANTVGGSLAGYVNSNNINGAVDLISQRINNIPYDSEVFMCGEYPLNTFDESKSKKVTQRVLKCVEPHHTGGHYQTDKQASEATGGAVIESCYDPCHTDKNHKKTPTGSHMDASTVKGAMYINTDEYFDLYFPTTGDFYESKDLGLSHTQQRKGIGYVDNMDTKEWIRERYVKFDFDVLFYRTETGLWEQYRANEWIELPVKNGHDEEVTQHYNNDQYGIGNRSVTDGQGNTIHTKKEDWYSFYCTLNNNEKGAATVTFEAEAINAPNSQGKYYPRDKYPVFGDNGAQKQSLSEKFFRYKADKDLPGEVFGNDYKYTKVFDREDVDTWVDFPFMVWKQNSEGEWLPNTASNRKNEGFIGAGKTYLTREQNRYNRVLGPTKDNTQDENPATDHRNDNDNKNTVTNARRKGNLSSLHGAHLVQTTDIVGRIGNFFITNTTDVRFANFFKVSKDNGVYLINGIVKDVYDSLQRNYFSWHLNGVAGNKESLARDVRNRWVGRQNATDPGYNWLYDTWKTQYWKSARDGVENTYEPDNGAKLDKNAPPATEPAKGTGTDKLKYGPLITPISSDKNNLKVYRDKELLKPGYTVNYEITTTGNYASKIQIKPYFYALSLSNKNEYPMGTIVPVDVWMFTDEEYKPINLWGYEDVTKDGQQKFPAQGLQVYDYMLSLNWQDEKSQRMISDREDELTNIVHNTMFESTDNGLGTSIKNDESFNLQPVAIPNGDYFKLGNLQLQRVYNSARTFIGQNLTTYENFVYDLKKSTNKNGVDLSDTNFENKFDLEDYAYRAQRWHLKLGLPSSAVFTVYSPNTKQRIKPTDEVYAKIKGDTIDWGVVEDTNTGEDEEEVPTNEAEKVLGMDVIRQGDYAILMTANIRALGPVWNLYYSQYEDNGTVDIHNKRYTFTTDNFLHFTNPELYDADGTRISNDLSNSQVLIAVYNGSDTSTLDVDVIGTH